METQLAAFVVTNEAGHAMRLFSPGAYRAEFRYLQNALHKTDLAGPPVDTDGWTRNIPEAEWPFLGFAYFGYACGNLAQFDAEFRDTALAEMRWLIEALQTPRLSGFIASHFGEPFGTGPIHVSVFVHGHFLNLTLRYREVTGDTRYDPVAQRVATALFQKYLETDQGILPSYKTMWWLTDNFPALSALSRYDRIFKRDTSQVRDKFLSSLKKYYLDPKTGMFCTYVSPISHRQLQGPRGISQMYGLHFLRDFAPGFAAEQYSLAKQHLMRNALGVAAAREFPAGVRETPDVDSGPVLFGLGPSASGFAIAAAAINGDEETAWQLLKASAVVGGPVLRDNALRYSMMPPVGQAVILFGKTCLLKASQP